MKLKICLYFMFILLFSIYGCNKLGTPETKEVKADRINFEAGGFVLAQVPAKDGNTIYARTDVGGVYKKVGNKDWKFISDYSTTPASLMVQSIDINPNDQNEILVACGMDYLSDDEGRGVWKSKNGGDSWQQILGPQTGNPELNFGGNVFRIKLGGPCVRWHPSVPNRLLAGGLKDPSTGKPYIYISDDDGEPGTWKLISSKSPVTGNIVCLQVHPKFPNELWVGTDEGLWITRDNGISWSSKIFPDKIDGVYQMLLKVNSSGKLTGFVSTGKLFRLDNNAETITELTSRFGNYNGDGAEIIALQYLNNSEDALWCGMMGYPAKHTTNDGETWSPQIDFTLETEHNPRHTLSTEDKIYTSNIIVFQNPVHHDTWYLSGGAGPFISTNNGRSWRYNGSGIDMVVVYDVTFSSTGDIYIPISDWGMAKTSDKDYPSISDYSRKYTLDPPPPEKNGDSYIPNVCRVLVSKNDPNRIYLVGGSVFTYYPAITRSENRGEPGSYQIMDPPGLPSYPSFGPGHDAIISDGDITTDGTNDNIILLVGGGNFNHTIYDPANPSADWYGLYYSSNSGASFNKSIFNGSSDAIYKNSIVGGLFSSTDYLDVDPVDPSRVYFYLEGGNNPGGNGGGLFISTDRGKTFTHKSYIVNNPAVEYRGKGTIDIDPEGTGTLWAGIKMNGLYKSTDRGESFNKLEEWKSVSTLDTKGDEIAVFGMMNDDTYNKIYFSHDGGSTWEHLVISGFGVIPSVRKLDVREDKKGELWISTGGQGLFVYKY